MIPLHRNRVDKGANEQLDKLKWRDRTDGKKLCDRLPETSDTVAVDEVEYTDGVILRT